jgi:hypothetical protein
LNGPTLGVMLFSLSGDLWRRRMTRRQTIEAVASLGPNQEIELIGAQSLRGFPQVANDEIASVRSLLDRTGVVPSVYCADLDRGRSATRTLSLREALELADHEAGIARQLGFPALRVNAATADLLEHLARLGERQGLDVLIELGAEPRTDAATSELVEGLARLGSPHVGLIADGSAFVRRLPEPWRDACLAGGIPQEALDVVIRTWDEQRPLPDRFAELAAIPLSSLQRELAMYALMTSVFLFRRGEVDGLRDMLPFTRHVQTKFFATSADGRDPCVPYDEIVPLLKDAGFSGGLHAEYEGGIWSETLDTMAELRRHQGYLTRLWEAPGTA